MKTDRDIQLLLLKLGIPTNYLGFLYLTYAMQLTLSSFEYITRLSKMLYVEVAEKYKTEPRHVERCIRHALTVAFSEGFNDYAATFFEANGKVPTNTQFISRMYFHLISEVETENEKEA